MIRKLIPTGILLILHVFPAIVFAAPSITSIGGNIRHGQSMTINGSGFGTHANYNAAANSWKGTSYLIASFKDFEDNSKTSQNFNANYLNDITLTANGPTNSTRFAQVTNNGSDTPAYGISQSGNNNQSIYTSFWFMMPSGTSGGKPWRWYFGSNSSNDNLYVAVNCGGTYFTMQGDMLAQAGFAAIYGKNFTAGTWHKVEIYASATDDAYKIWLDGVTYLDFRTETGKGPFSSSSHPNPLSPNGHTTEVPDMIDGTGRGCAVAGSYNYDDFYIDYTPARIEICDGSTWSTRGTCNTQIPSSWSSSSIGIVVNQGTFSASSTKYLYVVDSSNNANTNGVAVTFGTNAGGTNDTTLPTVSISSPTSTTVSGVTNVDVTASDNISVTNVELYLDGFLYGNDSTSPYSFSWNTATQANSTHTLYAKAYDAAGNVGQSSVVTVTVNNAIFDVTVPITSITSPTSGTVSGTTAVNALASDNIGVTKVEFYCDGTLLGSTPSSPYNFSWNTTSIANGSHGLYTKAYDAVGNIGQSVTVTVTVSNTASSSSSIQRNECTNGPVGAIFCEDFEGTNPKSNFDDYDGNLDSENQVILDSGPSGDTSNKVIRFRVPVGQAGVSDLLKILPSNYDKLYARWYFKYEPGFNFAAGDHGGGLAAGNRNYVGQSGNRPTGSDFAWFGMQYNKNSAEPFTYSYYRGMYQDCSNPNGSCWGDSFPCVYDDGAVYCKKEQDRPTVTLPMLVAGQWYCYEQMVDMGTASADGSGATGRLTQWLDGKQFGDNTNLWFRTTSSLMLQNLWLSLYQGDSTHSTVGELIDNVVVSTQRIGCGGPVSLPPPGNAKTTTVTP